MRRPVLRPALAVGLALVAALGARPAPGTSASADRGTARAAASAVQISGASGGAHARVGSTNGALSGGGPFAADVDPGLVSVGASSTRAVASPADASGAASATLEDVSLLDGIVTVAAVRAEATAGAGAAAGATSAVSGLRVAGADVAARSGVVAVPPYGTLSLDARVSSTPAAGARRTAAVALRLRLERPFRTVPAGTEVLLGVVEAGAAPAPVRPDPAPEPAVVPPARPVPAPPRPRATPAPDPPPARPTPRRATPRRDAPASPPTTAGGAPARPAAPAPAAAPSGGSGRAEPFPAASTSLFDLSRSQAPPPGGFRADPPIDADRRRALLGEEYVFPVVGGASFSEDFGAPRADTGFHQGIDLFAPMGTPLVAVHDGTLFNVGWNALGGRRLWLEDGEGNAFYYAHLSAYSPVARDGATVRAGEVIGFMGDSGDAVGTPPHLHFEIHPSRGWAVPPFAYVSAWRDHATPGGGALRGAPLEPPGPVGTLVPLAPRDIAQASALDRAALLDAAGAAAPAEPGADAVASLEGVLDLAGLAG